MTGRRLLHATLLVLLGALLLPHATSCSPATVPSEPAADGEPATGSAPARITTILDAPQDWVRLAALPEVLLLRNREGELYLVNRDGGSTPRLAQTTSAGGAVGYLQGLGSSGFVAVLNLSMSNPDWREQHDEDRLIRGDGNSPWHSVRSEIVPENNLWVAASGGAISSDGTRLLVSLGGVFAVSTVDGDTLDPVEVARWEGTRPNTMRLGWGRRTSRLRQMAIDNSGQRLLLSCSGSWRIYFPDGDEALHVKCKYEPHPTVALLDLGRGTLTAIPSSVDDEVRHIAFLTHNVVSVVYRCGIAEAVALIPSGEILAPRRNCLVNLLIDDVHAAVTHETQMTLAGTRQGVPGVLLYDWLTMTRSQWIETPRPVQAMTSDSAGAVVLALEGGRVVELTHDARTVPK